MTPEQFQIVSAAVGGSVFFLAVVSFLTRLVDGWLSRRMASDTTNARKDGVTQDDKERLWKRVDQLEVDRAASELRHAQQIGALSDRHDRELSELRTRLDRVSGELSAAKAAVALTEMERQQTLGLYTALLQAHEKLQIAHNDLQLQVTALRAENTEMRRRLPTEAKE